MFRLIDAPTNDLILQLVSIIGNASEILRDEYQKYCTGGVFNIDQKLDSSPVTQADYRIHQYMIEQLEYISDLPILSEEGEHEQRIHWDKFWLLDPLDGTKEFLHQRAEFTINLSQVAFGQTSLAMLAIPSEYTVYIAPESGLPLKFNYQLKQWFIFDEIINVDRSIVCIGLSQSGQSKSIYEEYIQMVSQLCEYSILKAGSAYKFCMMLEGKIDIYPRFHPTCEWDTSAGQCLLERINGGLIDFSGRPFQYNQRQTLINQGFIAYRNNKMKNIALEALELTSKRIKLNT